MAETSENRDFSSSQKKGYSDFEVDPCQLLAQSGHSSVLPYVDNRRTILKGMGNNRSGRRYQVAYECQLMPKTDM